jgi:hypothetical protein
MIPLDSNVEFGGHSRVSTPLPELVKILFSAPIEDYTLATVGARGKELHPHHPGRGAVANVLGLYKDFLANTQVRFCYKKRASHLLQLGIRLLWKVKVANGSSWRK